MCSRSHKIVDLPNSANFFNSCSKLRPTLARHLDVCQHSARSSGCMACRRHGCILQSRHKFCPLEKRDNEKVFTSTSKAQLVARNPPDALHPSQSSLTPPVHRSRLVTPTQSERHPRLTRPKRKGAPRTRFKLGYPIPV